MYPRLFLARQLLQETGVICVSIDDFEAHHLRMLMNEVFGEENFIAQLVWDKARKNDAKFFSVGHEYMLVYAKSKGTLRENKTVWREPKPGAQEIWDQYLVLRERHGTKDAAIEKDLVEWYQQLPKTHPSKALARYRHIDKFGPWRDRDISWPGGGGPRYDVNHPRTKKPCRVPEAGWRFSTIEAMQRQIALGNVEFRDDHSEPPFLKAHLKPRFEELFDEEEVETEAVDDFEGGEEEEDKEEEEVGLQVMSSYIYKQSQVAVKYLKALFKKKLFDNPKDHEVLARIIRYCSPDDALVMDFFAGSASTAEAVLSLNRADRHSRRRFLLVQLPEPTRRRKPSGKYQETAAWKAGFKTITELSKQRIRLVLEKLRKENAGKLDFPTDEQPEDLGFKVFKLSKPSIEPWVSEGDRDPDNYTEKLFKYNDPLVPGWKAENLLWEVALREGLGLNTSFVTKTLPGGNTVCEVTDPEKDPPQTFAVCLDNQVRADLSKEYPLKPESMLICRDVALDDSAAANLALQCRLKTI
jgi:adenine-specific DNA-methyltransferase